MIEMGGGIGRFTVFDVSAEEFGGVGFEGEAELGEPIRMGLAIIVGEGEVAAGGGTRAGIAGCGRTTSGGVRKKLTVRTRGRIEVQESA